MLADIRQLLRNLRRSPASAGAAVVSLAVTLGAGTSIAALVDAVLLTPPPFANPDALVTLGELPIADDDGAPRAVAYATVEEWRERARSVAVIEAFDGTNLTLTGRGQAERISAVDVTTGLLVLLGVQPERGRAFDVNDLGRAVVIVSHSFWQTTLSSDPDVIGQSIALGGQPHTIVGVLPKGFSFALSLCDIWRPMPGSSLQSSRTARVHAVARLGPDVSPAILAGLLQDVSSRSSPPARVVATPVASAIAGDASATLGLLAGAAVLTLLIAFANVAGLLIVRSIDRRRELAVRTALGARRRQIVSQLVLEAEAIVAAGVAGGVLLAVWMTPVTSRLVLEHFGMVAVREVDVGWRAIGFVSCIAAACAAICGALPAFLAVREGCGEVLRRGATASPRELTLRRLLVSSEVALAFVLLVSVVLLGGSLRRVLAVTPGFSPDGVLALQVSLPGAAYPAPQQVAAFYAALQQALEERVGAGAASIVSELPLTGDGGRRLAGARPGELSTEAIMRDAGVRYFEVMGIPVIDGRSFDSSDDASAPARVMVSQTLVRRLFNGSSPIGHRLWLGDAEGSAEIIGITGDVMHRTLVDAALPTIYRPLLQSPSRSSIVVVRSPRPDADVIAAVREAVTRLDPDLPVYRIRSLKDVVDRSPGVPTRRLLLAVFLGFAVLALVLGALGLFGVVAHDVARRRTELALRLALGADPKRILLTAVGQGLVMIGAGLAAGAALSFWTTRAFASLLVATTPGDVLSLVGAAVVLITAGAVAVLPAAVRAARTDPVTALRSE